MLFETVGADQCIWVMRAMDFEQKTNIYRSGREWAHEGDMKIWDKAEECLIIESKEAESFAEGNNQ